MVVPHMAGVSDLGTLDKDSGSKTHSGRDLFTVKRPERNVVKAVWRSEECKDLYVGGNNKYLLFLTVERRFLRPG